MKEVILEQSRRNLLGTGNCHLMHGDFCGEQEGRDSSNLELKGLGMVGCLLRSLLGNWEGGSMPSHTTPVDFEPQERLLL